jgi:hypothetical protein
MELIKGRVNVFSATIAGMDENGLTGYEARFVIAASKGSTPLLKKAGVIDSPLTNKIVFTLTVADLAAVPNGRNLCEVNIWKTATPTLVYAPIEDKVMINACLDNNPTEV